MDKYYMSSCYEYPPKKKLHFKDRVEDTFFFGMREILTMCVLKVGKVCVDFRKALILPFFYCHQRVKESFLKALAYYDTYPSICEHVQQAL